MKKFIISIIFLSTLYNSYAASEFNHSILRNSNYQSDFHQKDFQKEWTVLVIIAADNNLDAYAWQNLQQMLEVGSNENVNIVVRLDMRPKGQNKVTKFLYVKKGELVQVVPDIVMDSGSAQDLTITFKIVHDNFPAKSWQLILWNHGIGYIDDPSIAGLDDPELWNVLNRGICFDDTTKHYLTNKKLLESLKEIKNIAGKKLSLLGCDACLMNMWEFLQFIQPYVEVAVGSQEVEAGTGWDYTFLKIFKQKNVSSKQLATAIVDSYNTLYEKQEGKYTQSAIALSKITALSKAIKNLAMILVKELESNSSDSIRDMINFARSTENSTIFDEPSYIDLKNFCLQCIEYAQENMHLLFSPVVVKAFNAVVVAVDNAVIHNKKSVDFNAYGISIYFPIGTMSDSYLILQDPYLKEWAKFLSVI